MFNKYLEKVLNEAVYTSEGLMTFGFELEGCVLEDGGSEELMRRFDETGFKINSSKARMREEGDGSVRTHADGTRDDVEARWYNPTEFQSPILLAIPYNFIKLGQFLKEITSDHDGQILFYTNESCGFHIHFGFSSDFNQMENLMWVIFQFIADTKLFSRFYRFDREGENIAFTNHTYATISRIKTKAQIYKDFLEHHETIDKESITELIHRVISVNDYLTHNLKFDWLSPHNEYGTMEWRGPRNFLNDKDKKDENVKKLVKTLIGNKLEMEDAPEGDSPTEVFKKKKEILGMMNQVASLSDSSHVKIKNYILSRKEFFQIVNRQDITPTKERPGASFETRQLTMANDNLRIKKRQNQKVDELKTGGETLKEYQTRKATELLAKKINKRKKAVDNETI